MPVFDTPITTGADGLPNVLAQPLPVALFLHDGKVAPPLAEALADLARKHAGTLLVVRVDVSGDLSVHRQYGSPLVPAIITLEGSGDERRVKSHAERASAADIRAHVRHLLEGVPLPGKKAEREGKPRPAQHGDKVRSRPVEVTDRTFKREVLQSELPVLVDFWAPWCAPCRSIAPQVEQIAKQYAGQVKVAKLNTDQNQRTAQQFGVRAIPTFIVFHRGQPVDRFSGANPNNLRRVIANYTK